MLDRRNASRNGDQSRRGRRPSTSTDPVAHCAYQERVTTGSGFDQRRRAMRPARNAPGLSHRAAPRPFPANSRRGQTGRPRSKYRHPAPARGAIGARLILGIWASDCAASKSIERQMESDAGHAGWNAHRKRLRARNRPRFDFDQEPLCSSEQREREVGESGPYLSRAATPEKVWEPKRPVHISSRSR